MKIKNTTYQNAWYEVRATLDRNVVTSSTYIGQNKGLKINYLISQLKKLRKGEQIKQKSGRKKIIR